MVVYSFYIFDRHTECIYSRKWTPRPEPTGPTGKGGRPESSASNLSNGTPSVARRPRHTDADDTKLIFGTIFSLRNMVRRLGGIDNDFLSYRTGEYKLHYYETPTNLKFVMLTDTKTPILQQYLHQIWALLYVEYVVKNPLAPVEHPGGVGVANELFEGGLETFVATVIPSAVEQR